MRTGRAGLAFLLALLAPAGWAEVRLNPLFTDHMVLQRNRPVPVYGTADPGEKVVVAFAGQVKTSVAAKDGKWMVKLDPMPASSKSRSMTLRSTLDTRHLTLSDVLVGDVWLCAGQSNMATEMKLYPTLRGEKAEAMTNQMVRLFKVKSGGIGSKEPSDTVVVDPAFKGSWQRMSPAFAREFSAVASFFGEALQPTIGVPVGLLYANRGGTAVNQWLPMDFMKGKPKLYERYLGPKNPWWKERPKNPGLVRAPSRLFNGTIYPLIPFAIRGTIWYQGESGMRDSDIYAEIFTDLIQVWRGLWGYDFPFLFVQLAPYGGTAVHWDARHESWAFIREAQASALKLPNTGMAVITDAGEMLDIHPQNKQPVGERLALLAEKLDHPDIVADSPLFQGMEKRGSRIEITFDNGGAPLETRRVAMNRNKRKEPGTDPEAFVVDADTLKGFVLCGADRKFVEAQARITSTNTVEVWSDQIPDPVAVRYGWANFPLCNLYNQAGLPASPFRTDHFPAPDFTSQAKPCDADFSIRDPQVSFRDGFDASNGWIASSPTTARWAVSGGKLAVGQCSSTDYVYFNPATRMAGAKLDLQAIISSPWKTVWGGLAFNYRDAGNFDALRIKFGTPSYQVIRFENGRLVDVLDSGSAKKPFAADTGYRLHFRAISEQGAFSIEISDAATGENVLDCAKTIPDLGSLHGYAGLYGANANGNAVLFLFDDFVFTAGE